MDKIKQNIDLQEAIQRYNIEKSVVGTLAYNIDQNLQKGMSPDEAVDLATGNMIESQKIQKSKSMPIGTIHNGFKKIAEGKWRKVSKTGKTKEEHEDEANKIIKPKIYYDAKKKEEHQFEASKLDSKDYSDEEVTGGEKKEEMVNLLPTADHHYKEAERLSKVQEKITSNKDWERIQKQIEHHLKEGERLESTEKSQPESTLSKSEQTEAQKAKVKKVMDEWKAGKLKSSSGEKVVDQKMALAIALSEAGLSKED